MYSLTVLAAVTFGCVVVGLRAQDADYPDSRDMWQNVEAMSRTQRDIGAIAAPDPAEDGWSSSDGVEVYVARPRLMARQASRSKRFFSIASPTDRYRSRYFRSTPKPPKGPYNQMALLSGIAD